MNFGMDKYIQNYHTIRGSLLDMIMINKNKVKTSQTKPNQSLLGPKQEKNPYYEWKLETHIHHQHLEMNGNGSVEAAMMETTCMKIGGMVTFYIAMEATYLNAHQHLPAHAILPTNSLFFWGGGLRIFKFMVPSE